jgi:hypothetical protein
MSASSGGDLMRTGFEPLLTKELRNEYWSSTLLDTSSTDITLILYIPLKYLVRKYLGAKLQTQNCIQEI